MSCQKIIKIWYQKHLNPLLWILIPFSFITLIFTHLKRFFYQKGILKQSRFRVPIIIVGNLTVGGTGKTPLVIHLAKLLKQHGFNPGIVSRGYKGNAKNEIFVTANSDPKEVGDEPLLLAKRLFCPIVVSKDRTKAIQALLKANTNQKDKDKDKDKSKDIDKNKDNAINVVLTDDGLQNYALHRDIEVLVIDGKRGFGNGWCLPAGPLREGKCRVKTVDFVVVNGANPEYHSNEYYDMVLRPKMLYNGKNASEQVPLSNFFEKTVHAVAGIGHPEQFFLMLSQHGLKVIPHPFPDHYQFKKQDIIFKENYPVIMTEKDAVKCMEFMNENHWIVSVDAVLNPLFDAKLLLKLKELKEIN